MYRSNQKRCRRGSALLLCTLAAVVISIASIAILRSNQRGIATLSGTRVSRQARATSAGLVQRAYAALRLDTNLAGSLPLPKSYRSGERLELTKLSPSATQIEVYLYGSAKIPAKVVIVDPGKLN